MIQKVIVGRRRSFFLHSSERLRFYQWHRLMPTINTVFNWPMTFLFITLWLWCVLWCDNTNTREHSPISPIRLSEHTQVENLWEIVICQVTMTSERMLIGEEISSFLSSLSLFSYFTRLIFTAFSRSASSFFAFTITLNSVRKRYFIWISEISYFILIFKVYSDISIENFFLS